MRNRIKSLALAGVAAASMALGGLAAAPAAQAVPGDPMAGCQTGIINNYCDGPIRPDGSWRRCMMGKQWISGGFDGVPVVLTPAVQNCFLVPNAASIPPLPLGQPPYHIAQ